MTCLHTCTFQPHQGIFGGFITKALPVTVGFELGGGVLPRLACVVVVDEYYCSETTTTQACLGYVSLGPHRATRHTQH